MLLWLNLSLASSLPCPPGQEPGASWPEALITSRPAVVAELDQHHFAPPAALADPARLGLRTDALLIVHRGRIVYERYGNGYTADTVHLSWSVAKSVMGTLAGAAVAQGRLKLDDSICEHLAVERPSSCRIKVDDVLAFATGYRWREGYENSPLTHSTVLAMLYGQGRVDMAGFVSGLELEHPPGSAFRYSTGDAMLLSAIVHGALSPTWEDSYPWALLFDPLGMRSPVFERDAAGTYLGGSYLFATPRDYARLGQLWEQDGCWGGRRLLPEGWMARSTAVSDAYRAMPLARSPGDVQGRQFWVNQAVPEHGDTALPWPSAPADAFAAEGHWGQFVTVIPSRDLVVVRTADDRDGSYNHDVTLRQALALVEGL